MSAIYTYLQSIRREEATPIGALPRHEISGLGFRVFFQKDLSQSTNSYATLRSYRIASTVSKNMLTHFAKSFLYREKMPCPPIIRAWDQVRARMQHSKHIRPIHEISLHGKKSSDKARKHKFGSEKTRLSHFVVGTT